MSSGGSLVSLPIPQVGDLFGLRSNGGVLVDAGW